MKSGKSPKKSIKRQALEAEYHHIAMQADAMLLNLEKLDKNGGKFSGVKQYAYKKAMRDIKSWGGKTRFHTKPPENTNQLKAKIADIKQFMGSSTSSRQKIEEHYAQIAETTAERYGTSAEWSDMAILYERKIAQKWNEKFGSKTAQKAIGKIQQNMDQIREDIEQGKHVDLHLADDKVNETVTHILQHYRHDLRKLGWI